MNDSYEPGESLEEALKQYLDTWRTEFEECWHLDYPEPPSGVAAADWTLAKALDRIGRDLLPSAHALSMRPDLEASIRELRPGDKPLGSLIDLSTYGVTYARLEIELASHALDSLERASTRVIVLLHLLSRTPLSERAAAFLDRATRLYIWGFDSEVAVMCRAVAEAALEHHISNDDLRRMGYERDRQGFFRFDQYVKAARRVGVLSHEDVDMLHEIRRAGNDAAHEAPGVGPEPLELLVKLIAVLRKLYPESAADA